MKNHIYAFGIAAALTMLTLDSKAYASENCADEVKAAYIIAMTNVEKSGMPYDKKDAPEREIKGVLGNIEAAIITAEALSGCNKIDYNGKAYDAVLSELVHSRGVANVRLTESYMDENDYPRACVAYANALRDIPLDSLLVGKGDFWNATNCDGF